MVLCKKVWAVLLVDKWQVLWLVDQWDQADQAATWVWDQADQAATWVWDQVD
jgi:hypothetical protein